MGKMEAYLAGHEAVEIKVGQSGADVYEIDGKYIVKHVVREKLQEPSLFSTYVREAVFYQSSRGNRKPYLSELLDVEVSEDEILLRMKKYSRPDRGAIDDDLLRKITQTLAMVHTDEIPAFLRQDRAKAEPLSDQRIAECLNGWKNVLNEHPGAFNEVPLTKIAENINKIIAWHDTEERVLTHGDFHWDNLLTDDGGSILICDWQGVGVGGAAGDLSFFLSRLGGDGIGINRERFVDFYIDAIRSRSGKRLDRREILGHMDAANVITSFLFWHEYLHGSTEARVREIYDKMTVI